jgi:hypothetical protein
MNLLAMSELMDFLIFGVGGMFILFGGLDLFRKP